MKRLITVVTALLTIWCALAQNKSVSYGGTVMIKGTQTPIDMATVLLVETNQWCVTDAKGHFVINGIASGDYTVSIEYLGYKTFETKVKLTADLLDQLYFLQEDNLVIEDVVITARESTTSMNTERKIEKTAIDHLQMVNMSDISSLLPGGKTINPNLMTDNSFVLRGGGTDAAAAAFGTAVEIDGVRLSTNASFGDVGGASTRNVASSNIESIEVITGIPSVEYGDMTGGIVKVKTRKGKTPYTATFTTNPNTKQISVGKGFDLGNDRGVLNSSFERTKAISNPTSPYTSYQRNVLTLNYSNTFNKSVSPLQFTFGLTGNLGGMDSENDPDAVKGTYSKVADNSVRANLGVELMLNKPWITGAELTASVNYTDRMTREREYYSSASQQPAVNSEAEGYFVASQLPLSYYNTKIIDSKQLDYNLAAKVTLNKHWGGMNNKFKAGLNYKANGNVGRGEYYVEEILPDGYRPRPYTDIPYMHNFAAYIEDNFMMPIGSTSLSVVAGLRAEKTIIAGSAYRNTASLSPRFNAKWTLIDRSESELLSYLSLRAGWGITEKLPSFNVLYPSPQYRDIQVFGASYGENQSLYVYHTTPYQITYNENLRWTRNRNFELGLDTEIGGVRFILVGYYNQTLNPYKLSTKYEPFSYKVSQLPTDYTLPDNANFTVDYSTGTIYAYDSTNPSAGVVPMDTKVVNQTFAKVLFQDNGSPIDRRGLELTVDFGQIKAINTSFRIDANYSHTRYENTTQTWRYSENTTHTSLPDRSYQYVGIYIDSGSGSGTYNGKWTRSLDANFTATTHIPSIRLIVSLRLEASLYNRSQAFSSYAGKELAFTVTEDSNTPTGGNIMDGNSYTALYPLYYMTLDGTIHEFTDAEAANPEFDKLLIRSGNAYQYNLDGYDPYMTANLSITKEIGDLASVSFYANNFTNVRRYIEMYATGVKRTDLIPEYYYGLTLRLKF